MSAQEWQPGDKALIEVEIDSLGGSFVRAVYPGRSPLESGYVYPRTADLLPVPQPDADTIERAAETLYRADRARHEPPWFEALEHHREPFRVMARALAAANLLASSVREPGRSECGDTGPSSDFGYPPLAACRLPAGHGGDHSDTPPRPGRSEAERLRREADDKEASCTGDWNGSTCDKCRAAARRLRARAAQVSDTEGSD